MIREKHAYEKVNKLTKLIIKQKKLLSKQLATRTLVLEGEEQTENTNFSSHFLPAKKSKKPT